MHWIHPLHRFTGPLALLGTVLLLLAGCSASQPAANGDHPEQTIDSLRAANEELHDSLQFYDDIYTGQYYRDRRILTDRLNRLEYEVLVARDGGRTIESLAVDDLFQPSSATLTDDGRSTIAELADTLQEDYDGREIRVEGHADSSAVSGSLLENYPSNWELSAARAAAIVRELIEAHEMEADRLGVISFGDTRPIMTNSSNEGRQLNRRIRVAVLP